MRQPQINNAEQASCGGIFASIMRTISTSGVNNQTHQATTDAMTYDATLQSPHNPNATSMRIPERLDQLSFCSSVIKQEEVSDQV